MMPREIPDQALLHYMASQKFEVFLDLGFALLSPSKQLSRGWYLSALARALEDVASGRCQRLIITMPPRHLKSIAASVLFPAWLLGRDPSLRIISASYGQDLAAVHARDFRKVINSRLYKAVFPATAAAISRDTDSELATTQGGYRYATAVGGTVTGRGADYIICDDLMKAQEVRSGEAREKVKRFIDETLLSRLDDKARGRVISIQQRLHEDDVVGHLLEKDGYTVLNLPAIAVKDEVIPLTGGRTHQRRIGDPLNPERESLEVLKALKIEMGARVFEAQYQQNPVPPDGDFVDWSRIQFFDQMPERHALYKVVQSWDTAVSDGPASAYSVGTTWGYDGKHWLLVDVIRIRADYSGVLSHARIWRDKWRSDLILVEGASMGPSLANDLRRDSNGERGGGNRRACQIIKITPRDSKEVRLMNAMERLYSGLAKFPREAPFTDDLRKEMLSFPNGRYDDQCDSISQFLNYMARKGDGFTLPPGTRPPGTRPPGGPRPQHGARTRPPLLDPFDP